MRPAALLLLPSLLLTSTNADAQPAPTDMRSGCFSWTNVVGLNSAPLFIVPSGSRFVLTDVTMSRVLAGGPLSTSGAAMRLTIDTGGATPVQRWIASDHLAASDPPLQLHWNTGIVFEPNDVMQAAVSVQGGPEPAVTVCWNGYLVSTTTTSVIPGSSTDDLGLRVSPNPVREHTDLHFTTSRKQRVLVGVFAVDGRRVRTLRKGMMEAGEHRLTWDGRDDAGRQVASGLYFAGVETEGARTTRRIARVR
jgi:flagellar hook capping protein FlgD